MNKHNVIVGCHKIFNRCKTYNRNLQTTTSALTDMKMWRLQIQSQQSKCNCDMWTQFFQLSIITIKLNLQTDVQNTEELLQKFSLQKVQVLPRLQLQLQHI